MVALILLRLTARYALEMSPSKYCSSKGFFPWTLCLLYVVALFATILSFWWHFPPPLYDFDGAFCHHFLCSDFIVILFRFQISKTGAQNGAIFEFRWSLDLPYIQTGSYHTAFIIFSTSFFLDSHITLSSYLSKILLISFRFLFWKVSVHFKRL